MKTTSRNDRIVEYIAYRIEPKRLKYNHVIDLTENLPKLTVDPTIKKPKITRERDITDLTKTHPINTQEKCKKPPTTCKKFIVI